MFSEPLAKIKNETKIKTSLRARGPPGVLGALSSGRILRTGRIGSGCTSLSQQTSQDLWSQQFSSTCKNKGLDIWDCLPCKFVLKLLLLEAAEL